MDGSFSFSNALRLIVLLNTGKLVKFYQNIFCFFNIWFWLGQYVPFHTIMDKFYFVLKVFCCLWVLSPRIWNVFFEKDFNASIKKMEKWHRDTQKVIFLFYFWVEKSKHMGLSFKTHLKHLMLKVAVWLDQWCRVGSVTNSERVFWFEYGQIPFSFFFIFYDFFYCLLEIECFTKHLFHILILYLIFICVVYI